MEPEIPDGACCLFCTDIAGALQGKTVLVQLQDAIDPETGLRFTVKKYHRIKQHAADGTWRPETVTLKPVNTAYEPIQVNESNAERLMVIGEMLEVLGTLTS